MIIKTNGQPIFVSVKAITRVYTPTTKGEDLHVYVSFGEESYVSFYMQEDTYLKLLADVQALKEKQIETTNND